MWLYIAITIVTIALSWGIKKTDEEGFALGNAKSYNFTYIGITRQSVLNKALMLVIFLILFMVSALRVGVGNDYGKYVNFMHLAYANAYVPTEVGFNTLTRIVYYLCGFENYILVFAIFSFFTCLFFLYSIYDLSIAFRWTFAMFMLLSYYFQSLSTVRYYLALSMAMLATNFIKKQDFIKFVAVVLIGALFHKSLLVILILYPACLIKWRRWMGIASGCFALSLLFLKDLYLKLFLVLYPSYEGTSYLSGGTSIMSIARCILVLGASYYYRDKLFKDKMNVFYIKCNALALFLYVFCYFMPVISRIGYYLTITQILLVPAILMCISIDKKNIIKLAFLGGLLAYFLAFLIKVAPADGTLILPYKTFLFNDMVLVEYQVTD